MNKYIEEINMLVANIPELENSSLAEFSLSDYEECNKLYFKVLCNIEEQQRLAVLQRESYLDALRSNKILLKKVNEPLSKASIVQNRLAKTQKYYSLNVQTLQKNYVTYKNNLFILGDNLKNIPVLEEDKEENVFMQPAESQESDDKLKDLPVVEEYK